ncbi:hypothetical protein MKX08_002695 [Trichoderma sp. CBMAI-0020]|nr:hypothetical protein MKX08_002695 [Trichoderma sp. CBMAI-0020]
MSSFHLFPLLPPEVRSHIYILATPPRIVHLHQQVESFGDFGKRLPHITIAARNLRPDVDYSSLHHFLLQASALLRRQRQTFFKQTKLEAYGFTSSKPAQFSWEFESIVPFDMVMQIPTLAFPLYRRATISSQAAIPPLLHACFESRSFLIRSGYRLAFPSSAQGPQTWFHFEQDTLLLDDDFDGPDADPDNVTEEEIARIPHTFRHFRPRDISRIRRLALATPTHPGSRILLGHKLNPGLKELILVEWGPSESKQALRQSIVDPTLLRPAPAISQTNGKEEHFCMLPVEETDALWTTLELNVFGVREHWGYEGPQDANLLKHHKLANGFDGHFMKDILCQLREEYEQRKEIIEYNNREFGESPQRFRQKADEYPPWSIHQMRFAHICTPYTAERIKENRWTFMEQFAKLAADAAQGKGGHGVSWTKQHRLPHPFVLQRRRNWPEVDELQHSMELEWWMKNGLPAIGSSVWTNS